jgi:hypothetical protein
MIAIHLPMLHLVVVALHGHMEARNDPVVDVVVAVMVDATHLLVCVVAAPTRTPVRLARLMMLGHLDPDAKYA